MNEDVDEPSEPEPSKVKLRYLGPHGSLNGIVKGGEPVEMPVAEAEALESWAVAHEHLLERV